MQYLKIEDGVTDNNEVTILGNLNCCAIILSNNELATLPKLDYLVIE